MSCICIVNIIGLYVSCFSVTTTISSLSTTEPIPWTVKQIVEELLKTYRFPGTNIFTLFIVEILNFVSFLECFVVFSGLFDSKFSDSSSNISVAVMLTIERILSSEHVDNMVRESVLNRNIALNSRSHLGRGGIINFQKDFSVRT